MSGQSGLRDCGPESVEIVDRSFGGNITSNLNTGYINPSTGLKEGHSVVIQKATQKIITNLNGKVRYRFTFKAVNPGYQGGIIESISMKQIKNAYNIFYIK